MLQYSKLQPAAEHAFVGSCVSSTTSCDLTRVMSELYELLVLGLTTLAKQSAA